MTDYWAVGMLNADKIAPALQPLLSKIKKRLDDDSVSGIPDVELQLTEHRFDRWMNQLDRLACKSGCDAVCIRASGDVLCECCGKPYRKAPLLRAERAAAQRLAFPLLLPARPVQRYAREAVTLHFVFGFLSGLTAALGIFALLARWLVKHQFLSLSSRPAMTNLTIVRFSSPVVEGP